MLKAVLKPVIDWYLATLKTGGYPLVALLMAIESSIVPLPSEVVIPPAAHLVWNGEGMPFLGNHLTGWQGLVGVVIAGTVGSWLGAAVMYWGSRWAGRPLVLRYGKYFFIKPEKVEGAERWAAHYGGMGIFMARLLPVVRHLIGIPAGIVRMNFLKYSIYTIIGSAIWCSVLCWLGVHVGGEISKGELHRVSYWIIGATLALGGLYYFFVHKQMKRKPDGTNQPSP